MLVREGKGVKDNRQLQEKAFNHSASASWNCSGQRKLDCNSGKRIDRLCVCHLCLNVIAESREEHETVTIADADFGQAIGHLVKNTRNPEGTAVDIMLNTEIFDFSKILWMRSVLEPLDTIRMRACALVVHASINAEIGQEFAKRCENVKADKKFPKVGASDCSSRVKVPQTLRPSCREETIAVSVMPGGRDR